VPTQWSRMRLKVNSGIIKGPIDSSYRAYARDDTCVGAIEERNLESGPDGTRHTFAYGQYRVSYEVHGSGDRVLVWMHGLLLDANLSRHLARRLAAQGNRVVLLDLLGHGHSDRPRHAGALRMDLYAEQVLCLLDELGVDQAVLGGVSLGTNVSLLTTVAAPERVRGLVLEMPVLESAVPAAVGVFMPVLILAHYGHRVVRLLSRAAQRVPPSGIGALDSFLSAVASDPDETAAVLHGVLIGPIAPTSDQRRAITAPALVLGHGIDLIHSFTDAERLTRQLPNARLIRTRTFAELWVLPGRLTREISTFLDRVWEGVEKAAPPGRYNGGRRSSSLAAPSAPSVVNVGPAEARMATHQERPEGLPGRAPPRSPPHPRDA